MIYLRAAGVEDAQALAEVHVATWQSAYRGLLPDDYLNSLSVDARARSWVLILRAGTQVFLAEQAAQTVGFVSYGPSRDEDAGTEVGEVYALYVHPRAWGTGVGRDLHDAAVACLSAQGFATVTLWVLDANRRARTFYARHGWHPEGTARTEQRPGATLTEVRYQRRVSPGDGE